MQRNSPLRIAEMNRKPGRTSTADALLDNPDVAVDDPVCAPTAAAPATAKHSSFWNGKNFAIAGAGAISVALLLAAAFFMPGSKPVMLEKARSYAAMPTERSQLMAPKTMAVAGLAQSSAAADRFAPVPAPAPPNSQGPMIARTVSLTILVKDFAASRVALDKVLAQVHGYPATLTVNTPEGGGHSLQASLRIPAANLPSALSSLRTLGHVLSETQSGEEVTQQHADLVARLQNSREEETRLRAILEQRTGKIEDVLQVEEAIARVRGDIESMEAEQKSLEHRVDFATVDLQLTEQYTEQLNSSAESASARMYNALIAGLRNASDTVLGIVLFLEEFGPAILVWLVILGVPALFIWRRYRRTRGAM
jgi:hypothetical protein